MTQVRHRGHRPKTCSWLVPPRGDAQVDSSVVEDCQVDPAKALGVATTSISTIAARAIVKPSITKRRPRGAATTPHGSGAGCANQPRPEKMSAWSARLLLEIAKYPLVVRS